MPESLVRQPNFNTSPHLRRQFTARRIATWQRHPKVTLGHIFENYTVRPPASGMWHSGQSSFPDASRDFGAVLRLLLVMCYVQARNRKSVYHLALEMWCIVFNGSWLDANNLSSCRHPTYRRLFFKIWVHALVSRVTLGKGLPISFSWNLLFIFRHYLPSILGSVDFNASYYTNYYFLWQRLLEIRLNRS